MRQVKLLPLISAVCISIAFESAALAKEPEKTKATKSGTTATVAKTNKAATKFPITEKVAVSLVMKRPEVKQFFANVVNSKIAKPTIDMDRIEGDSYVVHVYEVVNDGPDTSHTATMNWYYVNRKTGKVSKEF